MSTIKNTGKIKKSGKTKQSADTLEKIDSTVVQLRSMRDQAKTLAEDIKEKQAELLDLMNAAGIEKRRVKVGTKSFTASRQQTSTLVYDEDRLRKKLGKALWDKVTTRVLDKKKLEAFVASGEVNTSVLAECSTEKVNSPFVKVT